MHAGNRVTESSFFFHRIFLTALSPPSIHCTLSRRANTMEYHRLQLPACTFDACHDMFFMAAFMHVAEFVMRIFEFQGCTVAFVKLIRLYVQKGHDPAACRRFLKRVHPPRFTCADSGILCVCVQPCLKGLLHSTVFPSSSRGTGP